MINYILKIILLTLIFCVNSKAQTINSIVVNGNERISTETIIMFSDVNKSDVNDQEINNILKNLYNTNFFENVELTHLVHRATSENLDISFNSNKASMYKNIVYNKPGTHLIADRLEIDLITKNTKIFMDKKSEKIKIINYK